MRRVIVGILVAAGALSAQLRLDSLDSLAPKAKESVNIDLPEALLKMAAQMAKGKSSSLVAGLKGISVRVFEFDGAGKYQMKDLDPVVAQLTSAAGWSKILSAKEPNESAEIYARLEEGRIVGLTIIAAEATELAVVSIDGPIDLDSLKDLGGLGVPDVSDLLPPQLRQQQKQKGKEK